MEVQKLNYKSYVIGWYRFGTGPKPVIGFHGYGEQGTLFEFLGKYAGDQFSFFAIDLPFHGATVWKESKPFSHRDLFQVIENITGEKLTTNIERKELIVMGYSLGGRVALSLYQAAPGHFSRLVLAAPDGLKVNFWYWLATQTWLGNKFFSFTMKHPSWFFGFLKLMNRLGLVNASIFKFVNYYIGDKDFRYLLYHRWTVLRKLRPNLTRIRTHIKKNNTQVRLIYGRHDRIILSSVGEKFRKGIETQCRIDLIESGHQVLHVKHAAELIHALTK